MIELFGIDFVYAATEQLVSLVRAARKTGAHVKSLRTIVVAGGIPTHALLEAAAVHLCKDVLCRYGTSEVGLFTEAPASEVLAKPGLIGRVMPGFEMGVFDPNGNPCRPGETGVVKGRVKSSSDRAEDPWTDHGDVGWISAEGEVFVVGRTSDIAPADFANASARQISPVYEVEHLLRLEWDAADVAAILIMHLLWAESRRSGSAQSIARTHARRRSKGSCGSGGSMVWFACSPCRRYRAAPPARSNARS